MPKHPYCRRPHCKRYVRTISEKTLKNTTELTALAKFTENELSPMGAITLYVAAKLAIIEHQLKTGEAPPYPFSLLIKKIKEE